MARPQKNNLDYFPHDNSMRNDRKIKALRAKFEHKGYAIYNMLLEILCESELLILKWDETEKELVSGDLNIVSDELTRVSEYLFHIKLLNHVNGYVFCPQLDKRSDVVFGKRTKDLMSLRIGNGINIAETYVSESKTTGNSPETPQSKVKKSKEKKSKENNEEDIFFIFWDKYHLITKRNKTDKESTLKYWNKLKESEKEKAINTIQNYYDSLNDKKYCKKARTFLSDKNFNDEFKKQNKTLA